MKKETEEHTILSWKAPEFHFHRKGQWWFLIQAGLTLALTVLFLLTRQFLVAIIVVLGAAIIYQLAHQEPEVLPVIFSPRGLKYKGRTWEFADLKTFWIIEAGTNYRLHLQSVKRLSTSIAIPLPKDDVAKVRDFLGHYLPETLDAEEDLADRVNRYLRI